MLENPEFITCDLCKQNDYEVILSNCPTLGGPLVRCRNCQLIYVNPRNTQFSVHKQTTNISNRRVAVWKEYNKLWNSSLVSLSVEEQHLDANFALRIEILQRFMPQGKLLDVGCGNGQFLKVARAAGYYTTGIEPNEKTAKLARDNLRLNIITGVLPYENFPNEEFDIVSLLHVMEHLPFPSKELANIKEIIKPNGLLFIEVPNIDTIWYKLLGRRWRQFIPDHYYFFTLETLQKMLASQGFRFIEGGKIGKKTSVRFFLSRLWRYSPLLTRGLLKLADIFHLADKTIHVRPGDIIYAVARKEPTT